MILAREITTWDEGTACNHTYIMTESMDKIFGYFKRNNPKDLFDVCLWYTQESFVDRIE